VTANGRIQASFSAVMVVGPLLAGAMVAVMPVEDIFLIDAISFLGSAVLLASIQRRFNHDEHEERNTSIRQDVVEGLRYVWGHPVLRAISIMMALVNFFGSTIGAQLVFFAKERLDADDSRIGILYSADALGIMLIALLAGQLRKRWSFGSVALGSLMFSGALTVVLAMQTNFWAATVVWALCGGLGVLFNINSGSLRQAIVPNHLLGRVISVAGVIAWSAIPLGTLLGGIAIEASDNVALVYGAIGVVTVCIALIFRFTAIGHADRYLPEQRAMSVRA
jgi:Na+/melibiose symporter-like transporter